MGRGIDVGVWADWRRRLSRFPQWQGTIAAFCQWRRKFATTQAAERPGRAAAVRVTSPPQFVPVRIASVEAAPAGRNWQHLAWKAGSETAVRRWW